MCGSSDGRSLYDAVGPGYTLLRFDPSADVSRLVSAAAEHGMPLQVLDVDADDVAGSYDRALVLSRPDRHVAWRGNELPRDVASLVDRMRGAGDERL